MKKFEKIIMTLLILIVLLLGLLVLVSIKDLKYSKKMKYAGDMRDKYGCNERDMDYMEGMSKYRDMKMDSKSSKRDRDMMDIEYEDIGYEDMEEYEMISDDRYYSQRANQTKALVKRAVSDYNVNREDALSGVRNGTYTEDDLYVFVVKGEYNVGHPYRKDLENTKITERKDVEGYYYGKDIVTTTEDGKWVDYVFTIPKTNEQALKSTYCQKIQEHIMCAGFYHIN